MTTAGIFGTVVLVTDEFMSIEIAPGVAIEILPAAVARVVETAPEQIGPEDL